MEIQLSNPFLKKPVKEWGELNQNMQLQDLDLKKNLDLEI